MCKKHFRREHFCALKFSCLRSSQDLCAHAHAHSLKGTLNALIIINWPEDKPVKQLDARAERSRRPPEPGTSSSIAILIWQQTDRPTHRPTNQPGTHKGTACQAKLEKATLVYVLRIRLMMFNGRPAKRKKGAIIYYTLY